jgi:muconolactone delta-isomerase
MLRVQRLPRSAHERARKEEERMRFLVTIDGTDMGAGMPPEQLAPMVNQMVVPSLEQLAQWEQEGRIHGGGYTAARGGAFMMEADSPEEVDRLVASLPYFPLVKVDVKTLVPTSALLERGRAIGQGLQERVR